MSDADLENELSFFLNSQKKKPIFNFSALGSELAPDLETQLAILETENLRFIEIGTIDGKDVLDLSDAEMDKVQALLQERGIGVSAFASSIGKIPITAHFEPHLKRFERALEVGDWLGTSYIRIFGFVAPDNAGVEVVYNDYRAEVARRLTALAEASQPYGLILLMENAPGTFADTGEHCADLIDEVGSPNLRSLFNPANFVKVGDDPLEVFPFLREQVNLLHLQDAGDNGEFTLIGAGRGKIKEVLRSMWQDSYQGAISLKAVDRSFDAQAFGEAVSTVRQLLTEIEQEETK
jgi:3-dehydroshikimate dehydratase